MTVPSIPSASTATTGQPLGIPGHPRTQAECDLVSAQLAGIGDRLRGQIRAGLSPEHFALARTCITAVDAAQSLIGAMRLSLGPDAVHAPTPTLTRTKR